MTIVELGIISVFLDITMGSRNLEFQSISLNSAIIFPLLLIPGFSVNYRQFIVLITGIIALICTSYLSHMYGTNILKGNLLFIPLGFIATIILLGFLVWGEKKNIHAVYKRYKDPIILSGTELLFRLNDIVNNYTIPFLDSDVLDLHSSKPNPKDLKGDYFKNYKWISTLYRFCSFIGWLEIYRREVTFLDSGKDKLNRKIEENLRRFRGLLADIHLNNSSEKIDAVIFREEQRAIGGRMMKAGEDSPGIIGYEEFRQMIGRDSENQWIQPAISFFLDLGKEEVDFRQERIKKLSESIIGLIQILDKSRGDTLPKKLANVI